MTDGRRLPNRTPSDHSPRRTHPMGILAAITAAYVVSGKLGLMLALPPGYASAIFPPAGLAVAAAVIGGMRVLPAIFVGSLLLNLWVGSAGGFSNTALLAAAIVAFGSLVQSLVGAHLFRRVVGYPAKLDNIRDVLLFLALAPAICLVSASISVGGLFAVGIIGRDMFSTSWLTWWSGDTLGVLLMLPLVMIVAGEPRDLWRSRAASVAPTMLIGFALFVGIFVKVNGWERDESLSDFEEYSVRLSDKLKTRLDAQELLLEQLDSLFATTRVGKDEFARFVAGSLSRYPDLQAIEWAPRIAAAGRAAFEVVQRKESAGFEISELDPNGRLVRAGERSEYYPVTLLEPRLGNARATGFDLASSANRRFALELAEESGKTVATWPIRLIQEQTSRLGLLAVRPVHAGANGPGMVVAVLRPAASMDTLLAFAPDMLYARLTDVESKQVFFDSFPTAGHAPQFDRTVEFGTRHYRLETAPTAPYFQQHRSWQGWSVLAGGLLFISLIGTLLMLGTGYTARIEALVKDRTRELRESEAQLRATLDNAAEAVVTWGRDGVIRSANQATEHLFGYTEKELLGARITQLLPAWAPPVRPSGGTVRSEQSGHHQNGTALTLEVSVSRLEFLDDLLHIGILHDITERKQAEAQIHFLAYHDALTGLPNRTALYAHIEKSFALARRRKGGAAVVLIDFDHFKQINDSLGHSVGDTLLREVARRLREALRTADTVARLGGDEFVILLPEANDSIVISHTIERVLDALRKPYDIQGHSLYLTASAGIALYPDNGVTIEDIIKNADTAMYQAKSGGRNSFKFFSAEMNAQVIERLQLEHQLRRALEQGDFILHYQPQVDLARNRVVGFEALVRWQRDGELIPPAKFIPVAEQAGLILPIGSWVLDETCRQLAAWIRLGLPPLRAAINLSAKQFRGEQLAAEIAGIVARHGVPPDRLELEITESLAMEDPAATIRQLEKLREMGVTIAIDDFGTGYSSLAYLKMLPIDRLKIDRSFVKDICVDRNDEAIANATIALAHSLGLEATAEGVETEEQLERLRARGADEVQGYLFGRPVPAADFPALLAARGELLES